MVAVLAFESSAPGMIACRSPLLMTVVVSEIPLNATTDKGVKFEPLTVSVTGSELVRIVGGLRLVITGLGASTLIVTDAAAVR